MSAKITKPIAIGCDHGALELKEQLKKHLEENNIAYNDLGTYTTESVHYPVYADKVCKEITEGRSELGLLLCTTGVGMSMAANKHRGIRAALCADTRSARFTRMHNDANVLCMGAHIVGVGLACDILDSFINASFEGGHHQARVDMLCELEKNELK
mgnify:CR=1 FL=1